MIKTGIYGYAVIMLLLAGSCRLNSNLMFRSPKATGAVADSMLFNPATEYTMSHDDKFTFTLYTNGGQRIVEKMAGMTTSVSGFEVPEYIVRLDGTAELPVIGLVQIAGLTVQQCEDTLAKKYAVEYQDPFIQVRLTNQRVIVFPGNGSDAKVVPLQNNNTTLMEAIAQAGGIADRGRADRVKIMRDVNGKREVFLLDMSTIEGLKYADIIVQANDYIYVEPSEQLTREAVAEAAPIVSLISSALIIFTVITTIK